MFFPHYHLLFFNLPFVHHDGVNKAWGEVIGWEQYVRTEITGLKSWRQAFSYVAKYMAKPVELAAGVAEGAPAAGEAGEASATPCGDAAGSLVNGAYLTAKEGREGARPRSIGRSWGVVNRKKLPMAERHVQWLEDGPWLVRARELAKEQWEGTERLLGRVLPLRRQRGGVGGLHACPGGSVSQRGVTGG